MYRRSQQLLLLVLLLVLPAGAHAQARAIDPEPVGIDLSVNGRMQMLFNTSSAPDVPASELFLRKVRVGVEARIGESIELELEPEIERDKVGLGDANARFRLGPALLLTAGRAHRPFGIMEQTSSLRMLPIERGVKIRGVQGRELSSLLTHLGHGGRATGVRLQSSPQGAPLGLHAAAGVFADRTDESGEPRTPWQYIGRLGVHPASGLVLGAAWSRRDLAPEPEFAPRVGDAFLLDLEYHPASLPGARVVAEVATGDYDPAQGRYFSGGQLWAGYAFRLQGSALALEPLARVSYAKISDLETDDSPGGLLLTPGLNLYLGGLNRVLLNYDFWRAADAGWDSSLKVQLQVAF